MIKKLLAAGLLLLSSIGWGQTVVHSAGLEVPNVFTNTNQFTVGVTVGPVAFANLGTINTAPGTLVFISDGSIGTNPCTGGGTGAFAVRVAGAWNCAVGGGGGGGISRWDELTNPTNNQSLIMGSFLSAFNYSSAVQSAFSFNNTTAATNTVSQSSPRLDFCGFYWNGTSAGDCWD